MGRPREHGEETRETLIAAAERLVATGGPGALSVRTVADAAGTSTRAVYSLFGSKKGLVDVLAERAFRYLGAGLAAADETDDPAGDLIRLGSRMYRNFVREHPSLFRIAFQRIVPEFQMTPALVTVRREVWGQLEAKVARLAEVDGLGGRSVLEAAVEFNAMCEGLANAELRGGTLRETDGVDAETVWRDAFTTVVRGFAAS